MTAILKWRVIFFSVAVLSVDLDICFLYFLYFSSLNAITYSQTARLILRIFDAIASGVGGIKNMFFDSISPADLIVAIV